MVQAVAKLRGCNTAQMTNRTSIAVGARLRALLKAAPADLLEPPSRTPLQLLHPFPAPMSARLAGVMIERTTTAESILLDPMAGSGTVLAAARRLGRRCYAFDLDPLACLMMRVIRSHHDPRDVERAGFQVVFTAAGMCRNRRLVDRLLQDRFDQETRDFIHYWFPKQSQRGLLALWLAIEEARPASVRDVLKLAFSRVIIAKTAGASRAVDLPHTRPHRIDGKEAPDPLAVFPRRLKEVLHRLEQFADCPVSKPLSVRRADARHIPLRDASVDLVLTSSPYSNAIDYIRAHKFSLVWMGYPVSKLRELRSRLIGAEHSAPVQTRFRWLEDCLHGLNGPLARRRAILRKYFYDMNLVLEELHRVIRAGGACVFLVGRSRVGDTIVDTPRILVRLAEECGFEHVGTCYREVNPLRRSLPFGFSGGASSLDKRIGQEAIVGLTR